MTAASRAIAKSDFLTAALCDNLMAGRDPFAGFTEARCTICGCAVSRDEAPCDVSACPLGETK